MSSEDIKYLKSYVLFSHMELKHLEEISQLLERRSYPAGSTIFYEGEEGQGVYFLKKGRVKALKSNTEGEEQILEILQAGDVFGEVVLLWYRGISGYDSCHGGYGCFVPLPQQIQGIFLSKPGDRLGDASRDGHQAA